MKRRDSIVYHYLKPRVTIVWAKRGTVLRWNDWYDNHPAQDHKGKNKAHSIQFSLVPIRIWLF